MRKIKRKRNYSTYVLVACVCVFSVMGVGYGYLQQTLNVNMSLSKKVEQPISFATDSWEVIAKAVKDGNTSVYHVGDTKEIELSGDYAGIYTLRLANTSTPEECNGSDYSESACGFVVEFQDIIIKEPMNSRGPNIGGWPGSELYKKLNPNNGDTTNSVIYNALPEDLKQVIIDTKVISSHGKQDSGNITSIDKLYLLSTKEIWGTITNIADTATSVTRQLDYYQIKGVTESNYSGAAKQYQGSSNIWWTRSAYSLNSGSFLNVHLDGGWIHYSSADTSRGVSPAFRVG